MAALNKPLNNQRTAQMENNDLAILNNSQILEPGEVGLRGVRVIEAVLKSAAQQSGPILVSPIIEESDGRNHR